MSDCQADVPDRALKQSGGRCPFRSLSTQITKRLLQQLTKLLIRESCIPNDFAHRDGMDRIVSRNGYDPAPVCHHDVFSLTSNPETDFLQRTDRVEMIYAGQLRHVSHLDLSRYFASAQFRNDLQILRNRISDVLQGFLFCLALRMTTGEPGDGSGETFLGLLENNSVSHACLPARKNGLLMPVQKFSVPCLSISGKSIAHRMGGVKAGADCPTVEPSRGCLRPAAGLRRRGGWLPGRRGIPVRRHGPPGCPPCRRPGPGRSAAR